MKLSQTDQSLSADVGKFNDGSIFTMTDEGFMEKKKGV